MVKGWSRDARRLPGDDRTDAAAGTKEILECWFEGRPIREEYLIVDRGRLAGAGAHSYSAGNATRGSEAGIAGRLYPSDTFVFRPPILQSPRLPD